MRISRITQQAKRPDRYSVYLEGKYAFSLAKDQLAELGLKIDDDIDPAKIKQYKTHSSFGKLRDRTYRWLAIRLRSRQEIVDYLKRKTDDDEQRQKLLELLSEQGYIDDAKFAEAWIRHRTFIKPMASYRLKQELLHKRVPLEVIEDKLGEFELDDVTAARQLIAKKARRYPDRQKLMAYLVRQGFSYDVIKRALAVETEE